MLEYLYLYWSVLPARTVVILCYAYEHNISDQIFCLMHTLPELSLKIGPVWARFSETFVQQNKCLFLLYLQNNLLTWSLFWPSNIVTLEQAHLSTGMSKWRTWIIGICFHCIGLCALDYTSPQAGILICLQREVWLYSLILNDLWIFSEKADVSVIQATASVFPLKAKNKYVCVHETSTHVHGNNSTTARLIAPV